MDEIVKPGGCEGRGPDYEKGLATERKKNRGGFLTQVKMSMGEISQESKGIKLLKKSPRGRSNAGEM